MPGSSIRIRITSWQLFLCIFVLRNFGMAQETKSVTPRIKHVCKPGYFCSDSKSQEICPQSYYCPAGTVTPIPCQEGRYCPSSGMSLMKLCPKRFYCPSKTNTRQAGYDFDKSDTERMGMTCRFNFSHTHTFNRPTRLKPLTRPQPKTDAPGAPGSADPWP